MDRIAERLGVDPVDLGRINALKPGDKTATGQTLRDDTSAHMVLEEAVKRTLFRRSARSTRARIARLDSRSSIMAQGSPEQASETSNRSPSS